MGKGDVRLASVRLIFLFFFFFFLRVMRLWLWGWGSNPGSFKLPILFLPLFTNT